MPWLAPNTIILPKERGYQTSAGWAIRSARRETREGILVMSRSFWVVLGIDALIAGITIVFFVIGLADGSVSSENIGLWAIIFAVLAAIIAGGFWLKRGGYTIFGMVVLLVLAVPGVLSGIILLWFMVSGTKFI